MPSCDGSGGTRGSSTVVVKEKVTGGDIVEYLQKKDDLIAKLEERVKALERELHDGEKKKKNALIKSVIDGKEVVILPAKEFAKYQKVQE